jgi:hypothetical protein
MGYVDPLTKEEMVRATQKLAKVDKALRQHHISKDTATEYKAKIKTYLKRHGAL